MQCGILVLLSGIKPEPPALEVQSFKHWTTREVPWTVSLLKNIVISLFLTQFSLALLPSLWTSGLKCGFWIWVGGPRNGLPSPEVQFPQRPSLPPSSPSKFLHETCFNQHPFHLEEWLEQSAWTELLVFCLFWPLGALLIPVLDTSSPAQKPISHKCVFSQRGGGTCMYTSAQAAHQLLPCCQDSALGIDVWTSITDGVVLHTLTWEDLLISHTCGFLFTMAHILSFFLCLWHTLASLVPQLVKNLPAMWEVWVQSLGWENPPEEVMTAHSSILAWRIPMDRGARRAKVHGVAKSRRQLSDYAQHRHTLVSVTLLVVLARHFESMTLMVTFFSGVLAMPTPCRWILNQA